MQENNHRSVDGPGVNHVEYEIASSEPIHRLTISSREALVTLDCDE